MKKLFFCILFASVSSLATAQSTNTQKTVQSEAPKMETVERTSTMRGANTTQSTMASFHSKAIQRLHEAVDIIEEEEDSEILPSESAQKTDF